MEKLKNFSNTNILYSDANLEISVWKKNKNLCKDCGKPTKHYKSVRCQSCAGKIAYGKRKRIHITKEQFEKLWLNKKLSVYDIAKKLNCSLSNISRFRQKFGLPYRRWKRRNEKVE